MARSSFWDKHSIDSAPDDRANIGFPSFGWVWGSVFADPPDKPKPSRPTNANNQRGTIIFDENLARGDSGFYWVVGSSANPDKLFIQELQTVDSAAVLEPDGVTLKFTRQPTYPYSSKPYATTIVLNRSQPGAPYQFAEGTRTGRRGQLKYWPGTPLVIRTQMPPQQQRR